MHYFSLLISFHALDAGEGGTLQASILFARVIRDRPWALSRWRDLGSWAKLKSALMGDVIVLQHTLYAAEKQCEFLLNKLERIQSALYSTASEPADSRDTTPLEAEASSTPSTSSSMEPPSA